MRTIDTRAVEMIPIRLIISIAVIAAIAAMLGFGFSNFTITYAEHQIENECRAIESELYSMVASGIARDIEDSSGDGTKRSHTSTLPDNLMYLAFGVDPDQNNDGIVTTGLTEQGSVIVYRVYGGSKHVLWHTDKKFQFREGILNDQGRWIINGEQGVILTSGGKTTLTFELVEQNNITYILIQNNDGIEP